MRSLRLMSLILVLGLAFPASADILKVTIDGVIHPITEEVVDRAIREAEARGDNALLIVLRTPGGLETSMRKMIEKIVAIPRSKVRGPIGAINEERLAEATRALAILLGIV